MSPSQNLTRGKRPPRRGPPRPTTAQGPRSGFALALMLHVGVFAAGFYQWHSKIDPTESHAVPVDLITIAPDTNIAAQAPPPPDKIEMPQTAMEPPALPQFSEVEPAPEPPVPQIKIKPTKSEQPPEASKSKAPAQDFAALLNKLTAPPKPPANAKNSTRTVQGVGAQTLMTAALADALKSQIYRCWSPPVGAPNADDLVVDFDLRLNRNGTVASLQLAAGTATRNPYTLAAAEAARRAIFQCQGQGYRLPPERYGEWSEISPLRFDPRQMMNQ